mmetsp:Transcript_6657/g.16959  ORF Transcript_6657/g.16959 Transcript_6657/m.16959 type:complete len:204 (+) Transcript_6657:956-1567(+)
MPAAQAGLRGVREACLVGAALRGRREALGEAARLEDRRPDARAHAEGQGPVRGRELVPRAGRAGGAHVAGAPRVGDGGAHDRPDRDRGAEGGLGLFTHGRGRAPGGHERAVRGALRDHGLRAAARFFRGGGRRGRLPGVRGRRLRRARRRPRARRRGRRPGRLRPRRLPERDCVQGRAGGGRVRRHASGAARHGPGRDRGHPH